MRKPNTVVTKHVVQHCWYFQIVYKLQSIWLLMKLIIYLANIKLCSTRLSLFEVSQVVGARVRNLSQGTQCNVAEVVSSSRLRLDSTGYPAIEGRRVNHFSNWRVFFSMQCGKKIKPNAFYSTSIQNVKQSSRQMVKFNTTMRKFW